MTQYATIDDIRAEGFERCDFSDRRVLTAIERASAFIERVTSRWFEPRDRTFDLTWRGQPDFLMENGPEIIHIDSLRFVNTDGTVSQELDVSDYVVFNRHVREGLVEPDDRESPKIAFQFLRPGLITPRTEPRLVQDLLSRRVQEVRLAGRFGYTDPDPGVSRAIATDAGDAITAPDTITMNNGAFTAADVRAPITIAGAANAANNATRTINTVVSATAIKTVEQDLVTEADGFTASIAEFPQSGKTPDDINYLCLLLVARRFLNRLADVDPSVPTGARVLRESVRAPSRTFQADPRVDHGDAMFTGDPDIDILLASFMRPPKVAAV